jgi:hypothetical protein
VLLLVPRFFGQDPNIRARCIGVHDGDTITVLVEGRQQLRIRLAWIDAPELGQAFGYRAKQAMSELVFGKDLELRVYDLDKYGRTLAIVFVDGKDVCLEEVRSGYAWVYQHYLEQASADIQTSYQQAVIEAPEQRRGCGNKVPSMVAWFAFDHAAKSNQPIAEGSNMIDFPLAALALYIDKDSPLCRLKYATMDSSATKRNPLAPRSRPSTSNCSSISAKSMSKRTNTSIGWKCRSKT